MCRNCQRSQVACIYNNTTAERSDGSPAQASPASSVTQSDTLSFDLLDLGLMNHWTRVTAVESFPAYQQHIWQKIIPQEAQTQPMLMHGILAFSAIHLACVNPEAADRTMYRIRGLYHQTQGSHIFRSMLNSISKGNAHNLFAFSLILGVLTFASPCLTQTLPGIDVILDLFKFVRGTRAVWNMEMTAIETGPMAQLLGAEHRAEPYPALEERLETGLDELKNLSPEADAVYASAVDLLKHCLQSVIAVPEEVVVAPRWPARVSENFSARLRIHEPISLVILAHYAMVIRRFPQSAWWLRGWSEALIRAVDQELRTEEKQTLDWPRRLEFIMS